MKYIKSYESVNILELKKYLIWKSHIDSEIYHIVEVSKIQSDDVTARILYWYHDEINKLEKSQSIKFQKIPLEMFLPENILDQSDNLEELKNRIVLLKKADKYNI